VQPHNRAPGSLREGRILLVVLPALKLLTHVLTGNGYGYHRDELYYLACARHLDWGYVDHPPFSILVLRVATAVLGDSIRAIRLVPAVAGALTVLLVGLLARRLGGGPFAQGLAMLAALAAPVYLALDQYFSMNALDLLCWVASAYLLVLVLRGGPAGLWLLLGLVLGLGLQNKLSVLWLMAGLAVGLVLTPERRHLRTPWPWLAAAIALVLFVPHVLWQVHHGWPTLEFIHNATAHKLVPTTVVGFAWGQVLSMLFWSAPVWVAGLVYFLFLPGGRGLRALGWAYLTAFAILAFQGTSRAAYLSPAYTWLLAAGGVAIERRLASGWARASIVGVILAIFPLVAPLVLPLLPPAVLAAHMQGRTRRAEERNGVGPLPDFLSHMCGWEEIVAAVTKAHAGLAAEERPRAAILAPNYGVAGAIDQLGGRYGLPPASSGHNNYWLWGPRGGDGDPTIVVGRSEAELRRWWADVTRVGVTECDYCMPYENGQPIWVARRPRAPLRELWSDFKYFQ
jgi:hypothetical protein